MKLIVHDIRIKPLNPLVNSTVQVGKPEDRDYVTSYAIQNQGRNSVMRIAGPEGQPYIEIRPGDPAYVHGVEWPCVIRNTLTISFVEENQQQWTAAGTRPAVDTGNTDVNEVDALVHRGILVENFVNISDSCLT